MNITSSSSRTSSTSYTLEHTWKVEDISLHTTSSRGLDYNHNPPVYRPLTPYAYLESPPFYPQAKPSLQFVLALYPRGNREPNKDKFCVYLSLIRGGEARCRFTISLVQPNGEIFKTRTMAAILNDSPKSGYGVIFLESAAFIKQIPDNFPDDVLMIYCKVKVMLDHSVAPVMDRKSLQNPSSFTQLSTNFSFLLDSGAFSDVRLVLNKTKELAVHKSILSARSTVFRAMFTGNFRESRQNRVQIETANPGAFKAFLAFLYTGTVPQLSQYAQELLQLADQYDTASLKDQAEEFLASQLNPKSVFSTLEFAELHGAEYLKAKSLEYLVDNVAHIVKVNPVPKVSQTLQEAFQVPKGGFHSRLGFLKTTGSLLLGLAFAQLCFKRIFH